MSTNSTKDDRPTILPHILRAEMADAGNVFGLFDAIVASPPCETDFQADFTRLRQVIQQRVVEDPQGLAREILDRGIGTISYLVLRTTYYLDQLVQQQDYHHRYKSGARLPTEVVEHFAPQLMAMHRHLAEIVQLQATAARMQELALAKRLENEQVIAASTRAKKRGKSENEQPRGKSLSTTQAKPTPPTNGHHKTPAPSKNGMANARTDGPGTAPTAGQASSEPLGQAAPRTVTIGNRTLQIAEDGQLGMPDPTRAKEYAQRCEESARAASALAAQGRWPRQ